MTRIDAGGRDGQFLVLLLRCRVGSAAVIAAAAGTVAPAPAERTSEAPKTTAVEEMLTVPEVAELLGLTKAYVYEMVRRAILPAVRYGKYVRVRRSTLEQRILAEIEAGILSDEALERVKTGLQSFFGRAKLSQQELSASPRLASRHRTSPVTPGSVPACRSRRRPPRWTASAAPPSRRTTSSPGW